MHTQLRFHEQNLVRSRLNDELEKAGNTVLGEFIADLINIKGGGSYDVFVSLRRNPTSDYSTFHIEARCTDGRKLNVPYLANWDMLPAWANWFTISATGQQIWHEAQPEIVQGSGVWVSRGRMGGLDGSRHHEIPAVLADIPIGIDWRTLCFERPESMIARHKMGAIQVQGELPAASSWGWLEAIKRFMS